MTCYIGDYFDLKKPEAVVIKEPIPVISLKKKDAKKEETTEKALKKLRKKRNIKKNTLSIVDNPDKKLHEAWGDINHPAFEKKKKINLLNFPKPFRAILVGKPNCGKSLLTQNLILQQNPPPKNIFLIHQETFEPKLIVNEKTEYDNSYFESDIKVNEYKDFKTINLRTIPNNLYFQQFKKNHSLLIIDDIMIKQWTLLNRGNRTSINKLFSFTSTHSNLSICSSFQDVYSQANTSVYRFSNVFILFKPTDMLLIGKWANNFGIKTNELKELVKLCKTSHDTICLDGTDNTPAPIRYNMTTIITI